MENAIKIAIERQAKKLLERQKRKKFSSVKYKRRFFLRTGVNPLPSREREPSVWGVHPHFDPKYCISHSKYLARTIWRKIQERTYQVTPAIRYTVPKDSGGEREIMIFSIPDAAIANLFNRKLRDRNKNLQSPFCYSYRNDRTIFDAVLQTSSLLKDNKVYVIQYDFSKYFDSIKHDYINFMMENDDFYISPTEKYIIERFLEHRYASSSDYREGNYLNREKGVPQGCSLSLFLSNIAAHELDKQLERTNGMFVRFADDVVCTAQNYSDALNIASAFKNHCHYSGISINHDKSPGINLLRGESQSDDRLYFIDGSDIGELETIDEFDYIGHKFSRNSVKMSDRALKRIKSRISRIIYVHLLHNLKRGNPFSASRVGNDFYDWDLVTCINEIRRYMYGGLREARLNSFINDNRRISRFKGLMSFYPLVTSVQQFAELDGWLVSALRRAIKERARLIHVSTGQVLEPLPEASIISGDWYQFAGGIELETGAPSFVLAWRAARKAFRQYGLTDFEAPSYYSSVFEMFDTY